MAQHGEGRGRGLWATGRPQQCPQPQKEAGGVRGLPAPGLHQQPLEVTWVDRGRGGLSHLAPGTDLSCRG